MNSFIDQLISFVFLIARIVANFCSLHSVLYQLILVKITPELVPVGMRKKNQKRRASNFHIIEPTNLRITNIVSIAQKKT